MKVSQRKPNRSVKKREKPSLRDRIQPISFDPKNHHLKVLLYGESATGKTTLWSTFPKPILVITIKASEESEELRSIDPKLYPVIHNFPLEKTEEIDSIVDDTKGEYKTVVLDHASGFQDSVLKEILGLDEIPEQKNWGLAQQQDYGQCTEQCKKHFRKLLNQPANVVFIGHQRTDMPDEASDIITPYIGIELMPKLARWLNGQVSYICQTLTKQKEIIKKVEKKKKGKLVMVERRIPTKGVDYCLRVGANHVYTTKFRKPKGKGDSPLPDLIYDPDYDKLLALINKMNSR